MEKKPYMLLGGSRSVEGGVQLEEVNPGCWFQEEVPSTSSISLFFLFTSLSPFVASLYVIRE